MVQYVLLPNRMGFRYGQLLYLLAQKYMQLF